MLKGGHAARQGGGQVHGALRELEPGSMLYPTGEKQGPFWKVIDDLGNEGWVAMGLLQLAEVRCLSRTRWPASSRRGPFSCSTRYNAQAMHALSVSGLIKTYKNGVQALKGIDLDVEEGDFFALLGPNGAGKTTLIGIVTSLVHEVRRRQVTVFGHDIDGELERAKSCIGVVPQEINFNMFESPETIVINQAGFYGIERVARAPACGEIPQAAAAVGQAQEHGALAVRRHEAPADDRACADARTAAADPR